MKVNIQFNVIRINETREGLEIVFPYENKWYRLDWDKVPERFKILYVVYLKLQGIEIPDYLTEFNRDTIDISNTLIEIDLDNCIEIPVEYPLSG